MNEEDEILDFAESGGGAEVIDSGNYFITIESRVASAK